MTESQKSEVANLVRRANQGELPRSAGVMIDMESNTAYLVDTQKSVHDNSSPHQSIDCSEYFARYRNETREAVSSEPAATETSPDDK